MTAVSCYNRFMLENIILTLFLILYLAFAVYLTRLKPPKTLSSSLTSTISPPTFLMLILGVFFPTLMLLMYAPASFTPWYLFGALSLSALGFSRTYRFPVVITASLILARLISSHDMIHNLFIIVAVSWLAPLLVHLGYLNRYRFMIISTIWFLYDIAFVWLTPTARKVLQSLSAINFPLGLTYKGHMLGSGDLLWASLFLTLLPKKKRLLGATVLVLSYSTLVTMNDYVLTFSLFPLLVLWVPLGLVLTRLIK
jgi:hypothetical protein